MKWCFDEHNIKSISSINKIVLNIYFYISFDKKLSKSQKLIHFVLTTFLGNFLDALLVEFWTLFWTIFGLSLGRSFDAIFDNFECYKRLSHLVRLRIFVNAYLRNITIIFGRFMDGSFSIFGLWWLKIRVNHGFWQVFRSC